MHWFSLHYFVLGVVIGVAVLLAVGVLLLAWSVRRLDRAIRVSNLRRAARTPATLDYAAIAQHMSKRMAAVEHQRTMMQQQREAAAAHMAAHQQAQAAEAMRTRRRDGDADQTVTLPPVRA